MGLCDKSPEGLICDEVFWIQDNEKEIYIGKRSIPPGSTISGEVDLTVLECEPVISFHSNEVRAALVFFIQKKLVVTTPKQEQYPLEFGFRISREVTFEKLSKDLRWVNPRDVRCNVVSIAATFDEMLTIEIRIRLFQDIAVVPDCSTRKLRLKT